MIFVFTHVQIYIYIYLYIFFCHAWGKMATAGLFGDASLCTLCAHPYETLLPKHIYMHTSPQCMKTGGKEWLKDSLPQPVGRNAECKVQTAVTTQLIVFKRYCYHLFFFTYSNVIYFLFFFFHEMACKACPRLQLFALFYTLVTCRCVRLCTVLLFGAETGIIASWKRGRKNSVTVIVGMQEIGAIMAGYFGLNYEQWSKLWTTVSQ